MSKRKYTHFTAIESVIITMREAGHTNREIADHLGVEKRQIECWVNRRNRKQKKLAAGIPPKPKGRPRIRPLTTTEEYQHEIAKLRMENKLLRDFLQSTERK